MSSAYKLEISLHVNFAHLASFFLIWLEYSSPVGYHRVSTML